MASLSPKTGILGNRLAAHLLRRASYHFTEERVESLAQMTVSQAENDLVQPPPRSTLTDSTSIRYKNMQLDKVAINLPEETSKDQEVKHPAKEKVGYQVFESEGFISEERIADPTAREDSTADELNGANAFHINCYPNPFVSNFTVEPLNTNADRLMVEVTDIQGRQVFYQYDLAGNQTVKISANHFAKGMYLVRVVTGDHVATFKMIKK